MGEGIRVAIVGLGNVGFSIADKIASERFPNKHYKLNELVLCSTNPTRTATDTKTIRQVKKSAQMLVSYCPLETLEKKKNPEIVINCASVPEAKKTKDRFEMGLLNMDLNRKVCDCISDHSLLMIVTNHVLDLQQDAINRGRLPERTIGCTLVDTMRAKDKIEELARLNNVDILDLSKIYVIGDHEDGSMILSPTSRLNGSLLEKHPFLEGKLAYIEKEIAKIAHDQVQARGNTNPTTSKAVVETLYAILTNGTAICGIECNFRHNFFGDALPTEKPLGRVTMSLPVSFKKLNAGLPDENDSYETWFEDLPAETKQRFYHIASGRQERISKLIANGKVSARVNKVKLSPLIKTQEDSADSYKVLLAINKEGQGFVCEADASGSINEIKRYEKELRKIGIIEGKIFATTRDSVYFDGKEIKITGEYSGNKGINSFVKLGSRFFAAHSDIGLLCSEAGENFQAVHSSPAREAVIFDGKVYFTSNKFLKRLENQQSETESIFDEEIFSLIPSGNLLYVACRNVLFPGPEFSSANRFVNRKGSFISASKMGNNILLLTKEGVTVYDPKLEVMPSYEMPGFRELTSNEKQAFVYNDFKITSVFGESCLTLKDKDETIISAFAHSQPF